MRFVWLLGLLILYPHVELTRVILMNIFVQHYYQFDAIYFAELFIIWSAFGFFLILLSKYVKYVKRERQ